MVCERGADMDMSGEGGAGGGAAGALQQRWYESRVNGSPAAGDATADANGEGFFHSPLEGGHHSRARYYHQQMHPSYSAAVSSHGKFNIYLFHFNSDRVGKIYGNDAFICCKLRNTHMWNIKYNQIKLCKGRQIR